ncbi:MAG: hypothetical protein IKK96_03365, partial [Lachnospiraceae bacterium]|nr:hypothetical protein [Lachnospiraceae bacterium]
MINNKKSFRKTFNTITAICLAVAMMLSVGCGSAPKANNNIEDDFTVIRPTTTPVIKAEDETNIMPTITGAYDDATMGGMYLEAEFANGMYDAPMADYDYFNTEE